MNSLPNIDKGISPEDKVANSKATILREQPFFGVPIFKLIWVVMASIPTACTDGKTIRWNPKFFNKLTKPESNAVILHEVFHVILKHSIEMLRLVKNNPQYNSPFHFRLANMAMDYVINLKINDMEKYCKWIKLPKFALLDEKYRDMHWIEVFNILLKENEDQGEEGQCEGDDQGDQGDDQGDQGSGSGDQEEDQGDDQSGQDASDDIQAMAKGEGSNDDQGSDQSKADKDVADDQPTDTDVGGMGGVIMPTGEDGQELSQSEIDELEKELEVMIEQSRNIAEGKGNLPTHLAEIADESKKSKVNWDMILRKFVAPVKPKLQSFNRLNKKYSANGIKMPSTRKSGVAELAFGIDTSSSTSMEEITTFMTNAQKVVDQVQPDKVTVHWFTSRVWKTDEYKTGQKFIIPKNVERGGTSFDALFTKVNNQTKKPKALVVLTDMGDYPPKRPTYPVLWVSTREGQKVPYGTITYLDAVA